MKKRDIIGCDKDEGVIPEGRNPPVGKRKTKGSPHDDSIVFLEEKRRREGEERGWEKGGE